MTVRYNTNIVTDGLRSFWDPGNLTSLPSENLFTYSEEFSNEYWSKTGSTIVENNIPAPDGTLTAEKLIGNTGVTTRQSVFASLVPVTVNKRYRFSVYLRQAERRYATIWFDSSLVSEGAFYGSANVIDLQNGTFAAGSGAGMTIQSAGNGWYRVTITATPTTAQMSFSIALNSANNGTAPGIFTGDGVSGIHIWGAQLSGIESSDRYIQSKTVPILSNLVLSDLITTNGNNIPLIGAPQYSPDGGGSFVFGGLTTQKCVLNTTSGLPSGDLTMMAWVRPSSTQTVTEPYTGIIAYGTRANVTPSTAVGLGINTTNATFSVSMAFWNNDYVPNSASVRAISNQWNLIGLIARSAPLANNVTLFSFNSSGYNSITGSSNAFSRGLRIENTGLTYGTFDTGNTRMLTGNMGMAMIYGRPLSEAEIKQNIDTTRGRYGL